MRTSTQTGGQAEFSSLRRIRAGVHGETSIEVFFDLVYAFAITQISHFLLDHASLEGAFETAILVEMVWLVWFYTTSLANWLNPNHIAVRLALVSIMAASLVMSAGIPDAFGERGVVVGGAYAAMQVGRAVFAVFALRGDRLQRNFKRLLVWSSLSAAFAVAGGIASGHIRELLWFVAVTIELLGGVLGIYVPGLGRSTTRDWDIEGSHLAERTQSFVMIAIGESIILIGARLAARGAVTGGELAALAVAFAGSVAIWWVYFDRAAGEAEKVMASSPDPGRLGRTAYAYIHPLIFAGIIAFAAGSSGVLANPLAAAGIASATMLVGGAILFLGGHTLFKLEIWKHVSWARVGAIALLAALAIVAPVVSGVLVAAWTAVVVALVGVADQMQVERHFKRSSTHRDVNEGR